MQKYDKILSKYFLADKYYSDKATDIELNRQCLLESAYTRMIFTDLGMAVTGAHVEDIVIQAQEITERISRIKNSLERTKQLFEKALKLIGTRERILLFVYYRTGITLTNKSELCKAKEKMIDVLERIKEKEDLSIKKYYMQHVLQS
ncbi:hypothetical protein ACE38V_12785 [Cytobacillus sp. Hz8]|uniref:hypothetical protein n=1 Tax=Cytobacillus sp. Hz8 TaxID=3347168 RepID=UPI0035D57BDA